MILGRPWGRPVELWGGPGDALETIRGGLGEEGGLSVLWWPLVCCGPGAPGAGLLLYENCSECLLGIGAMCRILMLGVCACYVCA